MSAPGDPESARARREKVLTRFCLNHSEHHAIFDIGANAGERDLAGATQALPGSAGLCVRATSCPTYERLRGNVDGRGIEPFELALGSTSRSAELFVYRFSTLNSLVEDAPYAVRFGETASPEPVTVRTLDEFCSENEIAAVANAYSATGGSASS